MKSNHELAERYNKKCELLGLRSIKYKLLKDDRVELVSVDNRMDRLDIPSFITDIKAGVFKGKNYRYIKISGKIKDMSKMFMGIKSEELSVELVHPECVENANEMISQCKMLRSLMLINFNLINNITSIGMFRGDTVLVRLDISELKLPRCEVIDKLFELCTKLEEIDISGIGLRDIKRMVNIFYRCHRLRTVKLSGLDLRNVEVIDGIFNNCWSLEDIDIKGVKLNNVGVH